MQKNSKKAPKMNIYVDISRCWLLARSNVGQAPLKKFNLKTSKIWQQPYCV
jgi:hypothetical protein